MISSSRGTWSKTQIQMILSQLSCIPFTFLKGQCLKRSLSKLAKALHPNSICAAQPHAFCAKAVYTNIEQLSRYIHLMCLQRFNSKMQTDPSKITKTVAKHFLAVLPAADCVVNCSSRPHQLRSTKLQVFTVDTANRLTTDSCYHHHTHFNCCRKLGTKLTAITSTVLRFLAWKLGY